MPHESSRKRRPAATPSPAPRSTRPAPTPPPAPTDRARDAVHRALAHQAERYPDLDLAPLDTSGLPPRDANFAHAIYDTVLRRWITLGYLIDGFSSRPFGTLDARVRAVLLAGAAQLLLLDKVPPHAALNEAVTWTKQFVKPEAGGMVNAVLRRIAELVYAQEKGLPDDKPRVPYTRERDQLPLPDGDAVKLRQPVLPQPDLDRTAIATSHPTALLRRWSAAFGEAEATRLALHGLVIPPTLLNTRSATSPVPHTQHHEQEGVAVYTGSREDLVTLLNDRPDIWVQDASSTLAVASVADLEPKLVIDACAGQGTKTRQLARTFPSARIIATDIDPRRLRTLRDIARLEPTVTVINPDELSTYRAKADLILLDVPCSNSGVLPRRVEARYRCDQPQLDRLIKTQRQIITDALPLLAPRGHILYSTCSIEPEENEQQLAWAASLNLSTSRTHRTMPQGLPGDPPTTYRDGAFSALLLPLPEGGGRGVGS
ncbi:MAG TPA: transcription antitermination factor NusB [Phycisphaerales bacterium]|nr:transcription antitermination factor NusB [Phycisphaerales bacterium]